MRCRSLPRFRLTRGGSRGTVPGGIPWQHRRDTVVSNDTMRGGISWRCGIPHGGAGYHMAGTIPHGGAGYRGGYDTTWRGGVPWRCGIPHDGAGYRGARMDRRLPVRAEHARQAVRRPTRTAHVSPGGCSPLHYLQHYITRRGMPRRSAPSCNTLWCCKADDRRWLRRSTRPPARARAGSISCSSRWR